MITDENVAIERCVKMIKEGKSHPSTEKNWTSRATHSVYTATGPRRLPSFRRSVKDLHKRGLRSNICRRCKVKE